MSSYSERKHGSGLIMGITVRVHVSFSLATNKYDNMLYSFVTWQTKSFSCKQKVHISTSDMVHHTGLGFTIHSGLK